MLREAAVAAVACAAAVANGAFGYGFSSVTVPFGLLFFSSRALNPALVLVEAGVNAAVLWHNREALPAIWRRAGWIAAGLPAGAVAGTLALLVVAPGVVKLLVYVVLLAAVALQAAGWRTRLGASRAGAAGCGAVLGAVYALTTMSGPPLAVVLYDQRLTKTQFRAALALVRLVESLAAAAAYLAGGLFSAASLALLPWILPAAAVGLPAGAALIRPVPTGLFRRLSAGFNAWLIAAGSAVFLFQAGVLPPLAAAASQAAAAALGLWLARRRDSRGTPRAVPVKHVA